MKPIDTCITNKLLYTCFFQGDFAKYSTFRHLPDDRVNLQVSGLLFLTLVKLYKGNPSVRMYLANDILINADSMLNFKRIVLQILSKITTKPIICGSYMIKQSLCIGIAVCCRC